MDSYRLRMVRRLAAASTGLLLACGDIPRSAVDLQVDVHGAVWTDTERIRVCVDGIAIHEAALGNGRMALAALAERDSYSIQINRLLNDSADGLAGPVTLTVQEPHAAVDWAPCTECTPCTLGTSQPAENDPGGPTLGIRFMPD